MPVAETERESENPPTTFRWATVSALGPLRIRLDGDADPLDMTPACLVSGLVVDDRVWVQLFGRRVIVLGKAVPV